MATRIIVGLTVIAAIVQGLWPDLVPENILPLVIVVLGLAYGVLCLDAEDATAYLAVAIAVGGASATDVLGHIHVIGSHLDAIAAKEGGMGLGLAISHQIIKAHQGEVEFKSQVGMGTAFKITFPLATDDVGD
jgi:hypothetical protein